MNEIRVWAPNAQAVAVDFGADQAPMRSEPNGWWSVLDDKRPPFDYAFLLDGAAPLPDPRSPWQPTGVHGPSRTVDHAVFPWTDRIWQPPPLETGILYELHIGTFTPEGTFDAAISRIPHLVDLGVTHVELMPVAEFSGERGWGYDGVDLYAPHHVYGGPDGLKRLVNALHAAGLAVVLDVVYNHLGPSGNYLNRFGPYFTNHFRTPWGDAVNFSDAGSEEVRRFVIDNGLMWLRDYHFDGLRLDAIHAIVDTSPVHILETLAIEVEELERKLGRRLVLIAESDLNDSRIIRPRDRGGYGFTAQWSDDFHHSLHTVLTGERSGYYCDFGSIQDLAKALEKGFVYHGGYSEYRSGPHGQPLGDLPLHKLLGYLQNHDQIGNRARGERSSELMSISRLKIGAALVLTAPFIPMLFHGEEWGASTPFQYFTAHSDLTLAAAVSEGRRNEFIQFGWPAEEIPDPQDPRTLERSRLDWSEREEPRHRELLDWHRDLIRLRRRSPDLLSGNTRVRYDENEKWLAMERGSATVVCNFSDQRRRIWVQGRQSILLSSGHAERTSEGLSLGPESVAVLSQA